jgi:hypothetical protein
MRPRLDSRSADLGYAADAIKPFEDLTACELARRVRIERALAIGDGLTALLASLGRLPGRLLGALRGAPAAAPARASLRRG